LRYYLNRENIRHSQEAIEKMVKLVCALVGVEGNAFSVKIDASELVDELKKEIKKEQEYTFAASKLELFLARKGDGTWLDRDDAEAVVLDEHGHPEGFTHMDETADVVDYFGERFERKRGEIHVLVVIPKQDDMNPSYFIEPSIQRNAKDSIFRIMDTANVNKAIGMGVFFRDNLAVTCRHNLTASQVVNSMVTVRASNNDQEVVIQLRVVYRDTDLDFAILQSNHPRPFMMPWTGNPVNLRGCNLVLASFRIGIDPYQSMYRNEIGFTPASGVAVSSDQSHLLYWCATFVGDSGAALIMKGKYLVGIHEKVINALPEQAESGTRSSKKRKIAFARAVTAGGLAQACSALLVHNFVDAFLPSE
jgi:hypothetical protein